MKSALPLRCALVGMSLFLAVAGAPSASAQTVGLFRNDTAAYNGYTLWAAGSGKAAYLIDNYGRLVHSWTAEYSPAADVYLRPNGDLLWPVKLPRGAHVQKFDWDGNLLWDWQDLSPAFKQHHDIEPMPNGNVLLLTDYFRTGAEAIAAGRDPLNLTTDTVSSVMLIEIHPTGPTTGEVVWEWHMWDHLIQDVDSTRDNYGVVADHPELMDINIGSPAGNWLHSNAVTYNAEFDQVMFSLRTISEIFIIDHSTTTAEAAGHTGGDRGRGGDFLYRWGNPQNYRAGDATDQRLDYQHDPTWIVDSCPGAGNILIFNNGNARGYSSVDEIVAPVDGNGNYTWPAPGEAFAPAAPVWTWTDNPPDSFYANFLSSAQRLPNGNTLINNGPVAQFHEVTSGGNVVWRYNSPASAVGGVDQGEIPALANAFRLLRFSPDYPAFVGRDLTPGATIERYPLTISGSAYGPVDPVPSDTAFAVTATITAAVGTVSSAEVRMDRGSGYESFPMYDDGLHSDSAAGDDFFGAVIPRPPVATAVTYYIEAASSLDSVAVDPVNPPLTVYRFSSGVPCGNVDGTGEPGTIANVSDLTYLVAFLFQGGPPPPDPAAANLDGQNGGGGPVDIADLTLLVAFLFQGGPPPTC